MAIRCRYDFCASLARRIGILATQGFMLLIGLTGFMVVIALVTGDYHNALYTLQTTYSLQQIGSPKNIGFQGFQWLVERGTDNGLCREMQHDGRFCAPD